MAEENRHRELRDAFAQFATGITVVTAVSPDGKPIGLTANSFASVSLSPPLVSWCIDHASNRYQQLSVAEHYSISVLAAEQRAISDLFATRSWDDTAFDELVWHPGPHNVPQIPDVCARFHCCLQHRYPVGDHDMLIGRVQAYESHRRSPLVFQDGDYKQLAMISAEPSGY